MARINGWLYKFYAIFSRDFIAGRGRFIIGFNSKISKSAGSKIYIKGNVRMEDNVLIATRKGGTMSLGKSVFFNSGCHIICRSCIKIGDNVQLGHNVIIIDHDHDFKCDGGIAEGEFKCSPVEIGDNVWIGANTVILRGTKIGNNTIVGAGSVLKGSYPGNVVITQKRENDIRSY